MFEARADQADGLRRLFGLGQRALLPVGAMVDPVFARRAVQRLQQRIQADGLRVGAIDLLGERTVDGLVGAIDRLRAADAADATDRTVLVARPDLIGRAFGPQLDSMLLLLSVDGARHDEQLRCLRSIARYRGIHRFGVAWPDGTATQGRDAHRRLLDCAGALSDSRIQHIQSWQIATRPGIGAFEVAVEQVAGSPPRSGTGARH
jgi:hypothetical protein